VEPVASTAVDEGPRECSICLNDLDDEEGEDDEAEAASSPPPSSSSSRWVVETLTSCPHRFHSACVDEWVSRCHSKMLEATCPECRANIVRGPTVG
jgi:hypothetical protein